MYLTKTEMTFIVNAIDFAFTHSTEFAEQFNKGLIENNTRDDLEWITKESLFNIITFTTTPLISLI